MNINKLNNIRKYNIVKLKKYLIWITLIVFLGIIPVIIINCIQDNTEVKDVQFKEEISKLETQKKIDNSIEVLLDLGLAYEQDRNFEKSRDIYIEATQKYPEDALAWLRLGNSYMSLGDFSNAIEAYEILISIDGNKAYCYFYYSQSLIAVDLEQAIVATEKYKQLSKTDENENHEFAVGYFEFITEVKNNIDSNKFFEACSLLSKNDYIYESTIKVEVINRVLNECDSINDIERENLLKLKNELQNEEIS